MRNTMTFVQLLVLMMITSPTYAAEVLLVDAPAGTWQSATFQMQAGGVAPAVNETIQFLSTADDKQAAEVMQKLDARLRPQVVLNTLKVTEQVMIENGWTKCAGPLIQSDKTPFGFQIFSKIARCFYSPNDNSGVWLANFVMASVSDQSLFFTAIERLRRSMMRESEHRTSVRTPAIR